MLEVRAPFLEELAIRARQLTPLIRSGTATDAVGRLTRRLGDHRRGVPTLRTITTASSDAFDAFLRSYRAACIFHDRGLFVPYQ